MIEQHNFSLRFVSTKGQVKDVLEPAANALREGGHNIDFASKLVTYSDESKRPYTVQEVIISVVDKETLRIYDSAVKERQPQYFAEKSRTVHSVGLSVKSARRVKQKEL